MKTIKICVDCGEKLTILDNLRGREKCLSCIRQADKTKYIKSRQEAEKLFKRILNRKNLKPLK